MEALYHCADREQIAKTLGEIMRADRAHARRQEREWLRGMAEAAATRLEAAARDEDPAPWKLQLAHAEGLMQFFDRLDQSIGDRQRRRTGD